MQPFGWAAWRVHGRCMRFATFTLFAVLLPPLFFDPALQYVPRQRSGMLVLNYSVLIHIWRTLLLLLFLDLLLLAPAVVCAFPATNSTPVPSGSPCRSPC